MSISETPSLVSIWEQAQDNQKDKDSADRAAQRATRALPGEIAPLVLLPGDPGRAKLIATQYFNDGLLVMANREFHSYTGTYRGTPMSVISTGLGSPGAAMVAQDLKKLGVRAAIRVGTCGTPDPNLSTGDLIVATGAIRDDGVTKKFLPEIFPAVPDFDLTSALVNQARLTKSKVATGVVLTCDGFTYPSLKMEQELYANAGVRGFEMECSAVMIMGAITGVPSAAILSIDGHTSRVAAGDMKPDSKSRDRGLDHAIQASMNALIEFDLTKENEDGV